MKMNRLFMLLLYVSLGGLTLSACNDNKQSESEVVSASDTLRVGVLGLPAMLGNPFASLNAPTIFTWSATFDSLTYINGDGVLEPWLAKSWRSITPNVWEFKLREDVMFSNGERFTAEAVVNAVDYLKSPEASSGSVGQMLNTIAGARILDDYTVEITTRAPSVLFPREVASLRMVAPEHWRKLGREAFAREPHGTGPFKVVAWEPGVVRMEAFKESWRPPQFEKLEIYAIPEQQQRVQGIISGQLDIILGAIPDLMMELEAAGHTWVRTSGGGTYLFSLILNPAHPAFGPENEPLLDVRVRRAMNYAIDRETFIKILLSGTTTAPSQPVTPDAFGFNPDLEPYPYDPERAKALLAEAGYPNGFDLVFEVVPGTSIPNGPAIYQKMAEDLAAIGVRLELKTFALPQYFNAVHTGEFKGQGFMMDFPIAPQMDALRGMRLHSCLWKMPWLCREDDQAKIDAAMAEPDLDLREAMTKDLMRRYHEQAYMLYLYNRVDYYGVRAGLEGFEAPGLFIRYDAIRESGKVNE
ncbi:MAG: ABC transporter substrate-binding protein [Rhodospirillaceae bacterium]